MGRGINRFNAFLESGDDARAARRGKTGALWASLVLASCLPFALSLLLRAHLGASPALAFAASICVSLVGIYLSGAAFSLFALVARGGFPSWNAVPWARLFRALPLQIVVSFIIALVQSALGVIVSAVSGVVPQIALLCSILISLAASMVSAGVVFRVVAPGGATLEGMKGALAVVRLLDGSLSGVARSMAKVARPVFLFAAWSMVAALAAAIPQVSNSEVLYYGLALLNFAVAGFLEIDVALGIALEYAGNDDQG